MIHETAKRFKIAIASVVRYNKVLEANRTRHRENKLDIEVLKQDIELNTNVYHYERATDFSVTETGILKILK